jgi:hypothetical protein
MMTGRDPAFAASPSSPVGSRPDGLQSGVGREEIMARHCSRLCPPDMGPCGDCRAAEAENKPQLIKGGVEYKLGLIQPIVCAALHRRYHRHRPGGIHCYDAWCERCGRHWTVFDD